MLPSGYLIRPCEGGGSIIHIVDHLDLEPLSVPEVLRPLYESSTLLSQRATMAALRQLRQISQEVSQPTVTGWGRRPAALRALSQRLNKGFNEAVNGFTDEGWSMIESDGIDDVTILVNSSPGKLMGADPSHANGFPSMSNAVCYAPKHPCFYKMCLLQYLSDFLREHRSEWADSGIDSYSAAAINSGPYPQTVTNTAPWTITVAANTIDRAFPTMIILGNNQTVVAQASYTGKDVNKFYPIVNGEDIAAADADEDSARSCDYGSLNATLARGKVVLCFQSQPQRSAAYAARAVLDIEGVGVIFAQFPTKDVTLFLGIPCVQVDFTVGTYLLTYMESTSNPVVKFSLSRTAVGQQISPEVAFFSSRGPSSLSPTVLKPDIAAPGVNILASWSPASSSFLLDNTQNQLPLKFKLESGTSMACPHVSGIVALLKTIHPTWSPAAIKSALITTASTKDEYGQISVAEGAPHKLADPFDYGGGHVDPNKAINPGLIYDMKVTDYVKFLCSMGYNDTAISSITRDSSPCQRTPNFLLNLNLPSISIPELKHTVTVSRTVTNVGPILSFYVARVEAPPGINVTVEPSILFFNFTTKMLKFKVTFCSQLRVQGRYTFGNLYWEDGLHVVRIPLIVRPVIENFYSET